MVRRKKVDPAQMPLLELALKTAPCVPAIRQEVRDWVADGDRQRQNEGHLPGRGLAVL